MTFFSTKILKNGIGIDKFIHFGKEDSPHPILTLNHSKGTRFRIQSKMLMPFPLYVVMEKAA